MDVIKKLTSLGLHPAPAPAEVKTWQAWYSGHDKSFHPYTIYNGTAYVRQKRATMRMAKKISEDWANLILNERFEIHVNNEALAPVIQGVLTDNNFYHRANQLIELTFALGTGAFVQYIDHTGAIAIDYVRQDMIFPLSWDNGDITEAAFASARTIDGKEHTYINIHTIDHGSGNYVITNKLFNGNGDEIELPDNVLAEIQTNSPRPRFQIITPNIVNADNLDSPFGASVYAAAIDRLKTCDLILDSLNNEFNLGRKRIIVPISMAQIMLAETAGDTQTKKPLFDPADTAFYAMTADEKTEKKPVDITGDLRIEEHTAGMQAALNYLSDACGLGNDRYEYIRSGGVKTATEVISEQSDLYQNLRKHELVIGAAITKLVETIIEMLGYDADRQEIEVHFDDSIIQDSDAIMKKALLEYQAGLIDAIEYYQTVYGMTEQQATKHYEKIQERRPPDPIMDWRDPIYTDN